MLRFLPSRMKEQIVTLRVSLLFIFVTLFVISMLTLVGVFYFHLKELTLQAANLLMEETSLMVLQELDLELDPAVTATVFSAKNIREHVLDVNNENEMMAYMVHLLENLSLAQGVYWGGINGNFIYARKELTGGYTTEFIHRERNPGTDNFISWDNHHKEIGRVSYPLHFDPRTRPWYLAAIGVNHPVWTDVYLYVHKPSFFGITVAIPVTDENEKTIGVFGIGVRLDYLSRYIEKQKVGEHGEVFIVDKAGRIVASPEFVKSTIHPDEKLPNMSATPKPWLHMAYTIYQRTHQTSFRFDDNGVTYLAYFKPIPTLADKGWLIGVVDRASDFTGEIRKAALIYLLLDALIFIIGILVMSHLISRVVHPIKRLVHETEKIKNFNLEEGERIDSHIKEVRELSTALDSMKMGLRSFQKYVPASLVRQLIKAGEDATIGGAKREIVVFFSDIKDFTTITEKSESNQLMQQMCDYLDAFSRVIVKEKGTIDKFIGDAIMAFWGAPIPITNPCHHAARATLVCKSRLKALNTAWSKEGKPRFLTRFGIHFGEAIVGNLGSSERINYTALGDTVNIASRIVGANKLYGTDILVSESAYDQIKEDFVLRMVDKVRLKGKLESIGIYELLAEDKQSILFDIEAYREVFSKAFSDYQHQKWHEAIERFKACLKIYPEDTLALVFINRCQQYNVNPPGPEWDGVWHFSEK